MRVNMNPYKKSRKHYDLFMELYRCRSAVAFKGLTTYREALQKDQIPIRLVYPLFKFSILS